MRRAVEGRDEVVGHMRERFLALLHAEVDLDQLRAEILATVTATVEPSSISLWLRE